MRDLAILTFVTLDGVMQSPSMPEEDPSGGFTRGGWAAPYWESTMSMVKRTAMAKPYDMLFGRKTYDLFAGHWPNAPKSGLADRLNAARKYVVTSDPGSLSWQNSHAIDGRDLSGIDMLKTQDGPLLQVHGSSQLIQALYARDLIDEFRIWTFPVVVGDGKRLFSPGSHLGTLKLVATEASGDGVIMQTYRKA